MKLFHKIYDALRHGIFLIALSPLLLFVWIFGSLIDDPEEYEDF